MKRYGTERLVVFFLYLFNLVCCGTQAKKYLRLGEYEGHSENDKCQLANSSLFSRNGTRMEINYLEIIIWVIQILSLLQLWSVFNSLWMTKQHDSITTF